MKNALRMVADVTVSLIAEVKYFLTLNMAIVIEILYPFGILFLGQYLALQRGRITIGGEIIVPIVVLVITYYVKEISNRCNKGTTVPTPHKRFTEVDYDSGEVNVRQERLQELILYLADLEDWLERKGLL